MPCSMARHASRADSGVLQPPLLLGGEQAPALQVSPLREVALQRQRVGGVAGPRRDAVAVADGTGRGGDDRPLLRPGQAGPPGVDLRGRRSGARCRGQGRVGGVGHPGVPLLDLVEGQHPAERLAHRLLLGDHVGDPRVEVDLEPADPHGAVVAGGLEGRGRRRGCPARLPPERRDRVDEVGAFVRQRPAALHEALHGVGVLVRPVGPRGAGRATSRPRSARRAGSPRGTPSRRRPASRRRARRPRRTSPGRRPAPTPPAGRPRTSGSRRAPPRAAGPPAAPGAG